jgi:enamine deaminase RidA (YjgF/YER057c/UK114 family)
MTDKLSRSAIFPKNPAIHIARTANLPNVPGIRAGDYIFVSGMGPIARQVRITLENMKHLLASNGSSLARIVRVHVVLADLADVDAMEQVYREFFPIDPPARTVWSMQLRFGNGCEIECLALAGGDPAI